MSDRFRVNEEMGLIGFLSSHLKGWSRSRIKQRLQSGCVVVNGKSVTKHNHPLTVGDDVEVRATARGLRHDVNHLEILYSDRDLIAINKPAGLLSVATATEGKLHALAILREQLSRPKRPVKLWPVHRIDRDTSGVLLFATSLEVRNEVMKAWPSAEKKYLAIVEGSPEPKEGTIDQPLWPDSKMYYMHVGKHRDAKPAITHFQTERSTNGRTLLNVQLDTGRQHQIRAHMAWLGHPVIGDPRYGTAGPRLGLHALSLSFSRPKIGKRINVSTPATRDFYALLEE